MNYKVSLNEYSLNYTTPTSKNVELPNRTTFVLELESQEITGRGEAAPLENRTEPVEETREKLTLVSKQSPITTETLESLIADLNNCPATRHALTQAKMDLRSKVESRSLSSLFRVTKNFERSIPLNDLILGPPTLKDVKQSVQSGFDIIKFKADDSNFDQLEELEIFSTESDQLSGFRIDFNENLSPDQLPKITRNLSKIPLDYVEQPFERHDLRTHAELRDSQISVALDESLKEYTVPEIAEANAADTIVIKPMTVGGLDLAEDLLLECLEWNLTPVLTSSLEGPIGRAGVIQLSRAYTDVLGACGLTTGKFIKGDSNWEAHYIHDGNLTPPDNPGNSIPKGSTEDSAKS